MATTAELEYLRRQKARREAQQAQGYYPVTQGMSSEAEDSSWSSLSHDEGLTTQPQEYQQQAEQEQKSWWDTAVGFVEDLGARFASGIVGAIEGIGDLGANALGWLGEVTGAYDPSIFTDWAKEDLSEKFYNIAKTYGSSWSFFKNLMEGKVDEGYWNGLGEGVLDLLSLGNMNRGETYEDLANKYYGFDANAASKVKIGDWDFGNFLSGISESIGFMVPSIVTGGLAGGSEAAALGSMFLSAGGKQSETALNEGATAGQALASGVTSGAVEVVSEIATGKLLKGVATKLGLDDLAKGMGLINGFSYGTEAIGKASAGKLLGTMFEEGAEEVFSDLCAPMVEMWYKGGDAFFEDDGNFYLGSPEFWKQAGLSFASGAATGGIMSGVNTVQRNSRYSKPVVEMAENLNAMMEIGKEYDNAVLENKPSDTIKALEERYAKRQEKFNSQISEIQNSDNDKVKRGFRNYLYDSMNGAKLAIDAAYEAQMTDAQIQSLYDKYTGDLIQEMSPTLHSKFVANVENAINGKTKGNLRISFVSDAQIRQVINDYLARKGITGEATNNYNYHGFYNNDDKIVYLNENDSANIGKLIRHEAISHAILDQDTNARQELLDYIEKTPQLKAEFEAMQAKVFEEYKDENGNIPEETLTSETIAHLLENKLNDSKAFKAVFQQTTGLKGFWNKVKNALARFDALDNQIIKAAQKSLSGMEVGTAKGTALQGSASKTGRANRPLTKIIAELETKINPHKRTLDVDYLYNAATENNLTIAEADELFDHFRKQGNEVSGISFKKTKADNFVDLVADKVESEALEDGRKYTDQINSAGEYLTKGQVEFFKNSKARDKKGNLELVFHGSPNDRFNVFDSKYHSGADGTAADGTIHGGADVNWFTSSKVGAKSYIPKADIELEFDLDLYESLFYELRNRNLELLLGSSLDELPPVDVFTSYAKELIKSFASSAEIKVELNNTPSASDLNIYLENELQLGVHFEEIVVDMSQTKVSDLGHYLERAAEDGLVLGDTEDFHSVSELKNVQMRHIENLFEKTPRLEDKANDNGLRLFKIHLSTREQNGSLSRTLHYGHDNPNKKGDMVTLIENSLNDDLLLRSFGTVISPNKSALVRELERRNNQRHLYSVYLNMLNPMEIDAKGAWWYEIKNPHGKGKPFVNTRDLVNMAIKNGNDGLIIRNVIDYGGSIDSEKPIDVFVTLKSPNQIKEEGNLTPSLSPDIRFSKTKAKTNEESVDKKTVDQIVEGYSNTTDYLKEEIEAVKDEEKAKRAELRKANSEKVAKVKQEAKEQTKEAKAKVKAEYQAKLEEQTKEAHAETKELKKQLNSAKHELDQLNKEVEFRTLDTTRDVLLTTAAVVEDFVTKVEQGNGNADEVHVVWPKNFQEYSQQAFSTLSQEDISKEADIIFDALMNGVIEQVDSETGERIVVGKIGEVIRGKKAIKSSIQAILRSQPTTEARNNAEKKLRVALDKALDTKNEYGNRINSVRMIAKIRERIKKRIARNYAITDDAIARNGLLFLEKPFRNLSASEKGYSAKNFKADLAEVLKWYVESNFVSSDPNKPAKFAGVPYYAEIREALEALYESLGEPVKQEFKKKPGSRTIFGSLTSEQLLKAKVAMVMIDTAVNNAMETKVRQTAPAAQQSYDALEQDNYGRSENVVRKFFRKYKRGFLPAYVVLRDVLGWNTKLGDMLTTGMQLALGNRALYVNSYDRKLQKKIKDLKIKGQFSKTFNVLGAELSYDQALDLYLSLKVDANAKAIEESGVKYKHHKSGKILDLVEKGHSSDLQKAVDSVLNENDKAYADFILEEMNKSLKQEYIDWHNDKFGMFNDLNHIGNVGDSSYWVLNRDYQVESDVTKAFTSVAGLFKNARSRVGQSHNEVLLSGATSKITAYVNALGTQIYTAPVYQEAIATLNAKTSSGKSVRELLGSKVDPQDIDYLHKTMDDMLGQLQTGRDILGSIMANFSVAKLSLNIGTMLKQFLSFFTSNISMGRGLKGIKSRMFDKVSRKEFEVLYKGGTLVDANGKEVKIDPIGGLANRKEIRAVLAANADGKLSKLANALADIGMAGVKAVDLFTVGCGPYALMQIAQNEEGLKIGTKENAEWVKAHWTEFELSQIGGGALSKSGLSRGDYGSLAKAIFGFMQGANRAAAGSAYNQIRLYQINHKLDYNKLKADHEKAKADLQAFKDKIAPKGKFNEFALTEEQSAEYIKLQAKVIDTELKVNSYRNYKTAGGRAIPVQIVAGFMAQGVFVAIINQLMRYLRGQRKEEDFWDLPLLGEMAMASFVDWIPFVNSISNFVKGYEPQIPALTVLQEAFEVVNNMKEGDWSKGLRELSVLVGDASGIPVQTLYNHVYGMVRIFNEEAALQMGSAVYQYSVGTKLINDEIKEGRPMRAEAAIGVAYKNAVGEIGKEEKAELLRLSQVSTDFTIVPSALPSVYVDENGAEITITWTQKETAKKVYSKANAQVATLIKSAMYKALSDKDKARVIRAIYSAYRSAALYSALGSAYDPDPTISTLLATSKNTKVGVMLAAVSYIRTLEASKSKTRKQLAVSYVNKLGLTKAEKMTVLRMAGFSVDDKYVTTALRQAGVSSKEVRNALS